MVLLPRLLASASLGQRSAIYRKDVLFFDRLHDDRRATGSNRFQRESFLSFGRLECSQCIAQYASRIHFRKQQRVYRSSDRRQLCVGDAHDHGLRDELPHKFLQCRHLLPERANRGSGLQRLQRHPGILGIEPHHGTTMRTDVAADIRRAQPHV